MKYKPNLVKRVLATLIDYSLWVLIIFQYIHLFGTETEKTIQVTGWTAFPLLIYWIVYFVIVEGITGGTLGHHIFNLKVLTLDRNKIGLYESFMRRLFDPIDIFIYGIPAFIAVKYTKKNQRLGDLVAGTIIVDLNDAEQVRTSSLLS
ncbi:RDD family protein [Solitalea lacus]|uniref:RDD family protein n=1 Tax=Solitalea lacus TaxID=2911172 RepID=UPI001EDA6C71|nr:RDD family protein [Solitalea lacus]UKJ07756.1 RDD family protein [Solitalea lacus]